MEHFKRTKERIKDNLWKWPSVIALAYIVAWFALLFEWYIPTQTLPNPDAYQTAETLLFHTIGIVGLVVAGFIAIPLFEK